MPLLSKTPTMIMMMTVKAGAKSDTRCRQPAEERNGRLSQWIGSIWPMKNELNAPEQNELNRLLHLSKGRPFRWQAIFGKLLLLLSAKRQHSARR